MEYSEAGGKLIHEKNQKQKISWHCPFKPAPSFLLSTSPGQLDVQYPLYLYNVLNSSIYNQTVISGGYKDMSSILADQ